MSPASSRSFSLVRGFPRVSGDEPELRFERIDADTFSPRERG